MNSKPRKITTPAELGIALFFPFLVIVVGLPLTFTLACLSSGIDPAPIVGPFLDQSIVAVTPLAIKLFALWASYFVIYSLIAYYVARFGAIVRKPDGRAKLRATWRSLYLHHATHYWDGLWQVGGLLLALWHLLFNQIFSGWRAGTSPQLE